MGWWWRFEDDARTLLDECTAVLAGRGAEVLARQGDVPAWAWINLLAHGSEDELRAVAEDRPAGDDWVEGRGYLAEEVLRLVDSGRMSLEELQRDILVPLELESMSTADGEVTKPALLFVRVVSALDVERTRPHPSP